MPTLSRVRSVLRNLFRREVVERELDDELRAYVDQLTAEKIRAGLPPADAHLAALVEAGGVEQVKEEVRDSRGGARIEALARDIRHALRGLRRSPGFTVAVAATLTIGIGLNTSIFTLVYATISRPLPVRDAERVVNVYQQQRGRVSREVRGNTSWLSYAEFQRYAQSPAFSSSAAYFAIDLSVANASALVPSELVSCDYFRTTATRMALGRDFGVDECAQPGAGPVAVLSHALWSAQYGADSSVIGRVIRVNNLPLTVIGVAERGFNGISLQSAGMWVPLTMQPALAHGRDSILVRKNASWLMMVARLAPGATMSEARTQVAVTGRRLDVDYPGRLVVTSVVRGAFLNFPEVSTEGRVPLVLTMFLGFTIVAMACANVMNLLLARGLARRREMGIRLAIGAGRGQLIQQLLIESGLLSVCGTVLGMAFVLALPRVLAAVSPVGALQIDPSPDMRIIGYAFAVAIGTTVLVGLIPALQSTQIDLVSAFKGVTMVGRHHIRPSRIRSVVIGVQVAGSAMLLVMSALFVRGALRATRVDPGYATHNVVSFSLNLAQLGYDSARADGLYRELMDRIARTPGVEGVGITARMPLLARTTETIQLERGAGAATNLHTVNVATVSGSYFKTMGMRILRGAPFDSSSRGDGDLSAVISASMASQLWAGVDPIGKRFKAASRWYRISGIASDASAVSLARNDDPTAYLAVPSMLGNLIVVRTSSSSAPLMLAVPEWVHALDPQVLVQSERFEDRIATVLSPARIMAGATAALGGLALSLAAIGVAGVVSFGLGQRRREVAVRLAMGATGRQVVTLMMRQAATPIVAGTLAGLAIAGVIGQLVRRALFGVSPLDPSAFAGMTLVLMASAALATYLPARRAGRISPAATLRED
jgi:predicted permease